MSDRPRTAIGTYGSIREARELAYDGSAVARLSSGRQTAHTRYRDVDGVLREVKETSSQHTAIAERKSKLVTRPGYGRGGMLSLTSPFDDLAELWVAELAQREIGGHQTGPQ